MNLIKRIKSIDKNINIFENFRSRQYGLIEEFLKLSVDYIAKQNNNYIKFSRLEIEEKKGYKDVNYSELTNVECYIFDENNNEKLFIKTIIPTLVFDNQFYLNGNYYSPTVYLLDKPIVVKEKSIMCSGLFNSISIQLKSKIVTFTGVNIPIHLFIWLLIYNNESRKNEFQNFITKYKIKTETKENVLHYFANNIGCKKNTKSIIDYFESLLFDEYTKSLYTNCYGIKDEDINLTNIVTLSFKMLFDRRHSFVNLDHKRLVFIELLLNPLFKKVSSLAIQASKGFKLDELKLDLLTIIKNFNMGLKSNYLYDTGNLYSALLQHKISMLNPGAERAPSSVSSIHKSHFGKICPVTVSSQEPGKTVSIIANTKLDDIGQLI